MSRQSSVAVATLTSALMSFLLVVPPTGDALATEPARAGMTLEQALTVIEAGKAEAARLHAGAVIAVVDQEGLIIAQQRMDDPDMLASVDLAPGKARAAVLFKRPTSSLEKSIDRGRLAAETARGFIEMSGGLPLFVDGRLVGAVGVSTAEVPHDEAIATAAAAAFGEGR